METLKYFRIIILVHHITVYTDHKNIAYDKIATYRVLHWYLLSEEYSPSIKYIKVPDNDTAYTLIRLFKGRLHYKVIFSRNLFLNELDRKYSHYYYEG